jgi:hypothetical protein
LWRFGNRVGRDMPIVHARKVGQRGRVMGNFSAESAVVRKSLSDP